MAFCSDPTRQFFTFYILYQKFTSILSTLKSFCTIIRTDSYYKMFETIIMKSLLFYSFIYFGSFFATCFLPISAINTEDIETSDERKFNGSSFIGGFFLGCFLIFIFRYAYKRGSNGEHCCWSLSWKWENKYQNPELYLEVNFSKYIIFIF